jgi:hypothetical protein
MKALKDIMSESLLDMGDESTPLLSDKYIKSKIKQFLKENYKGSSKCKISKTPDVDGKYIVDSPGDLKNSHYGLKSLTNEYFKFGKVHEFDCGGCGDLKTLEGAPTEVVIFICRGCDSLKNLEGAPKIAKTFSCSNCDSLESLEGAPREVTGSFSCFDCESLESLKGAPKFVGGSFECFSCDNLKSLEGGPEIVVMDFNCEYTAITTLKGAPKRVRCFTCSMCDNLKSLEGGPEVVTMDFDCRFCENLKSLKGAPKSVQYDFLCRGCGKNFSRREITDMIDVGGDIQ